MYVLISNNSTKPNKPLPKKSYLCKMESISVKHQTSAEYIKGRIIDFFIQQSDDILIGNEVMYGIKRKVVDLLIIKKEKLIAIEIKGDNDDLRRLQEQISECRKIFDYIIICTTSVHLSKLVDSIPSDIGIFIIDNNSIKKIKVPKKLVEQSKMDMLYTMNARYLKQSLHIKAKLNSDEVRKYASKISITNTKRLLREYFSFKIKDKYLLFLADRGVETHIDDIPLLSSNIEIQ
jgi:hypothetical protein